MKAANLPSAPVKAALDAAPEPPRWWQRALWGIGCGLAALVVGYINLLSMALGVWCFDMRGGLGSPGFMVFIFQFLIACGAGVIGLVMGAFFPGRIGMGVMMTVHGAGATLMSALLLVSTDRLLAPFLLATALMEGLIAFLLLRPRSSEADGRDADKPTDHLPAKLPLDADDLDTDDLSPHKLERIFWSMGCALAAVAVGWISGGLILTVPNFTIYPGFDGTYLAMNAFYVAAAAGVAGMSASAMHPGRFGVGVMLAVHCVGQLVVAGVSQAIGRGYPYFAPYFLAAALLEAPISFVLLWTSATAAGDVDATAKPESSPSRRDDSH